MMPRRVLGDIGYWSVLDVLDITGKRYTAIPQYRNSNYVILCRLLSWLLEPGTC